MDLPYRYFQAQLWCDRQAAFFRLAKSDTWWVLVCHGCFVRYLQVGFVILTMLGHASWNLTVVNWLTNRDSRCRNTAPSPVMSKQSNLENLHILRSVLLCSSCVPSYFTERSGGVELLMLVILTRVQTILDTIENVKEPAKSSRHGTDEPAPNWRFLYSLVGLQSTNDTDKLPFRQNERACLFGDEFVAGRTLAIFWDGGKTSHRQVHAFMFWAGYYASNDVDKPSVDTDNDASLSSTTCFNHRLASNQIEYR